jgi:hypothetical protein
LGVGVEKRTPEWFLPFGTLWTLWNGKKRSKSDKEAFKTVRKRSGVKKKTFWSGNNRSGALFLLNLAKLIDFGFGVGISTIKRIQVKLYTYLDLYLIGLLCVSGQLAGFHKMFEGI